MKLGQIIKMVMTQAGEDLEDIEDYRESIVIYILSDPIRNHFVGNKRCQRSCLGTVGIEA